MIFRSKKADGDLDAMRRNLRDRHEAGLALVERAAGRPRKTAIGASDSSGLPEAESADLTPELVRSGIARGGCLLVRGLLDPDAAVELAEGVDRAYEARESATAGGAPDRRYFEEFEPDPRFDLAFERAIVGSGGGAGLWLADSPLMTLQILEAFERTGLTRLASEYLGERPVLSVNKSLLRKVRPTLFEDSSGGSGGKASAWHQDGAFMGDVNALNVWLSLSRCGDQAPGLDIVPRRLQGIVRTGTEGAAFDWSASRAVAEEAAGQVGIARPIFDPGDALLFDELLLHSTAAEPDMPSVRYAVESWFFGPSGFPPDYAPLAV